MKRNIVFLILVFTTISIAETNAPSVYYSSVLGKLKISTGGSLIIGDMWGSNLPQQSASGGKLVLSKGGAGLYEFKWTMGTIEPPDTEMKISHWCFGHYHGAVDQNVNGIRFVNNCRGRGDTPYRQDAYFPKRIDVIT